MDEEKNANNNTVVVTFIKMFYEVISTYATIYTRQATPSTYAVYIYNVAAHITGWKYRGMEVWKDGRTVEW